jgi:hypothetical protein
MPDSSSSDSDSEHPERSPYPIPSAEPAENGGSGNNCQRHRFMTAKLSVRSPPSSTSGQDEEVGGSQNPVFDEDSDIYDNDDEPVVKKKRSKNRE